MSKVEYTPIIGMEVHVELETKSKMFCGCRAAHFRVAPNTQVCPVCLGLPGALPVPNRRAIEDTVKIGLALGCQVAEESKFDRKHYFYADLPKGYQISQYDKPLCVRGAVRLADGHKVRITRVHLEEDTGKLVHGASRGESWVDYNRSGVPLVEIVTEPDFSSAEQVKEFLKLMQATVRYLGVSEADMEKGSMRLEANISVAKAGEMPDYKVEVKNVNSFRYIAAAIEYEVRRQRELLESGKRVRQETRGWVLSGRKTVGQRGKEEAKDYRYLPEPDIPPLRLGKKLVEEWREKVGLLPVEVRERLLSAGVRREYVLVAIEERELAEYCLRLVEEAGKLGVGGDEVVGLVVNKRVEWRKIGPREVVEKIKAEKSEVKAGVEETRGWVGEVVEENKKAVEDWRKGKKGVLMWLVGRVMAKARGRAEPNLVEKELLLALGEQ